MSEVGIYPSPPFQSPTRGESFVRISTFFASMYRIVSSTLTPKCLSSSGISSFPSNYPRIRTPHPTYNPGSMQNATPGANGVLKGTVGVS